MGYILRDMSHFWFFLPRPFLTWFHQLQIFLTLKELLISLSSSPPISPTIAALKPNCITIHLTIHLAWVRAKQTYAPCRT